MVVLLLYFVSHYVHEAALLQYTREYDIVYARLYKR